MVQKKKNANIASLVKYKSRKKTSCRKDKHLNFGYLLIGVLVIALVAGGFWLDGTQDAKQLKISLAGDGSEILKSAERKTIIDIVRKNFSKGHLSQTSVSEKIQDRTHAGSVSLLRTGFNSVLVKIESRRALFKVVADKVRLLSVNGQIYGRADDAVHKNLPLITGIIDAKRKTYRFAKDHTLVLTKAEQERINSLIKLKQSLNENNISVQKIAHIPYRGFELHLSSEDLRVVIGNKRFDDKVQRLSHILQSLTEQNKQAEVIELDYNGKAFIKEKKI